MIVVVGSCVNMGAYEYTYEPIVVGSDESDDELPIPTCIGTRGLAEFKQTVTLNTPAW
jgi:hypothetical protein